MAFFKTRSSHNTAADEELSAEKENALRNRARHRLIGASVLVFSAVVSLPWLFDTPPATVRDDTALLIAGQAANTQVHMQRNAVQEAAKTKRSAGGGTDASTDTGSRKTAVVGASVEGRVQNSRDPDAEAEQRRLDGQREKEREQERLEAQRREERRREEQRQEERRKEEQRKEAQRREEQQKREAQQREKQRQEALRKEEQRKKEAQARRQQEQRQAQQQAAAKPQIHAQTGAPQTPPVNYNFPETGRFVVQVGAYVEADKLAGVRKKLDASGLPNYTQRVTINGKQVTRVRLGPFTTRKELERTAARVRALGLPVSMYQL